MSLLRAFHFGPLPEAGGEIILSAEESSHLVRARRAQAGESVAVLDGRGGVAGGELTLADASAAHVRVVRVTRHPAPPARVLAVGLPKGDTFVEIVRQATELGATAVRPLFTARGEVRLEADRLARKTQRWQSAALEACKQSGNPWLPEVRPAVTLEEWLRSPMAQDKNVLRLVAALTEEAKPIASIMEGRAPARPSSGGVVITIGPEGDFTPEEYETLQSAGFIVVRLPGHILRVETACAVALAVLGA